MEHLSSYLSSEEESINLNSQTNSLNSYLSPNTPFKTNTQKFAKLTSDKALHFHNHHHLHHNHKKLRPYISLRKRNLSHDYNNNSNSSSDFVPCKRIDIHPYQSPTKNFELSPPTPISMQQSSNHYNLPQKTLYSLKVTKSMVTRVRWLGQLGEAYIYSDTFGKIGVIRTDKGQNLLQLNSPNNSFISDIQVDSGYDSRVVTSNWNGDLIQWDLTSNTAINHININNQIQCVKPTNPSSSVWLVGLKHGGFEAYDFRASSMGPILKSVNATPGPVSDMLTLQNSQNLVVGYNFVSRGGYNPCLQVFDLRTGVNLLNTVYNQPSPPTSFYHHPNLNKWYSKFQNDVINTYKSSQPFQQCKFIKFQSGHSPSVGYQTEISGNLNGTLLASGSNEGKMFIWDINTSKLLKSSQVYKSCLLQAEFHPIRDNLVLTRGDNGWIKLLH